jgi:uncharacterized protein (DUF1499 family)
MFKLGLKLLLTVLLCLLCQFAIVNPVVAQPSLSSSTPLLGQMPLFSLSGTRPTNLGVKTGKLASCPNSPNCVSSQAPLLDKEHHIGPIAYRSDPTLVMTQLKSVINAMPRTKIITETSDYLYAEFTSALMGFVDDVEFYLDPEAQVIHVRSASRLGQSDLGVNRKRIEEIRSKFAAIEAIA